MSKQIKNTKRTNNNKKTEPSTSHKQTYLAEANIDRQVITTKDGEVGTRDSEVNGEDRLTTLFASSVYGRGVCRR